ncbi:helix-turn-helix transcriptional regulator [Kitasatospora purpeofusca]|uniref:helix-turn-helix transcriptional regulator n=1 Tax=Kitasatospora purpeofusca TaxID=67352 RepID=UPI00224E5FD3|nr:PAS domain-containing protein [Kitasatospora purpeofusca]MCX4756002.1 PAS domain-containing protein [Kitasatospora purpeofusca]WSR36153.1 PAS domain-containing protein [Kitasatospora purpeofusca]WSR44439.1 PAS domain-containing protein [Kitasatospora purpeofusca]
MTSETPDPRLRAWAPVCQAVALLLGPYAEVVLHDAARDEVLAIWNPMGGRGPGDPSLLGELDALDQAAPDVYGPYPKLLPDGRRLSSVSAVLRDEDGRPAAVLCVNLDRGPLEHAAALLTAFAAPTAPRPEPLFEQDWTERMNEVIGGYVRAHGRPLQRLGREDRLAVLRELDRAGVLAVRRAVPAVAKALAVSRSTLYTLLAELRGTPGAGETPGAAEPPGAADTPASTDPRRPIRTDEGDPS